MIAAAMLAGWEATAQTLPLPAIPAHITAPADRADYLLEHFWDSLPAREVTEEELSEFLSVFPHASAEGRRRGAELFVALVGGQGEESVLRMAGLLEGYLLDRQSPVRDDAAYVAFADAMMAAHWPGEESTAYLRDMVMRVPVGSEAPDFSLRTIDGVVSLRDAAAGRRTVLLFHSPGCEDCHRLIERIGGDSRLSALVDSGKMRVVAVSLPGDDEEHATEGLPTGWIAGVALEDVGEELYSIPAFPTLYLLSPEGRVELKDATFGELVSMLGG